MENIRNDNNKQLIVFDFKSLFAEYCRWNEFRAKQAIDKIVGEGLAWVDDQSDEKSYWFPSLFPKREQTAA